MQGFKLYHVSKWLRMVQRILYEFYCMWTHVCNWYVSCCGETGTCTCTRCHWQMHVYNVYCCILFFNRRVNSFRHSDGILRHTFRSTLVQVMVGALRHQVSSWTNVDVSPVRSNDIHLRLRAVSYDIPEPSITKFSLKIADNFFARDCKFSGWRWS